mmetsp:Transcript_29722/g.87948  ORF Transcript_29722/g.87948 Transcript_29722/m.87948 type:complete len:202 (+) Transcript_29722:884-1489(+)
MQSSEPGTGAAPGCSRSWMTALSLLLTPASPAGVTTSHQHVGMRSWWLQKSRPGTMPSCTSSLAFSTAWGSFARVLEAAPDRGTGRLCARDQKTLCAQTRSSNVASRVTPDCEDSRDDSAGRMRAHCCCKRPDTVRAAPASGVPASSLSSSLLYSIGVSNVCGRVLIHGASDDDAPFSRSTIRYAMTTVRSSATPCSSIQA